MQWQWIPRHRNSAADTLARAALGAPAKVAPHPSHKKRSAEPLFKGTACTVGQRGDVAPASLKRHKVDVFATIFLHTLPVWALLHASRPRAR